VSLEFFIAVKSIRSHYGPGVDSASNRNEYQEHFLGVKAAGVRKADNLTTILCRCHEGTVPPPPVRLHIVFTDSFTLTLVVTDCPFRPQKPFVSYRRFGCTIGTAAKIVTACSADDRNNVMCRLQRRSEFLRVQQFGQIMW